jgi:hypothetical protein
VVSTTRSFFVQACAKSELSLKMQATAGVKDMVLIADSLWLKPF